MITTQSSLCSERLADLKQGENANVTVTLHTAAF